MSTEKLLKMKRQVEEAKNKQAEISGQIKSVTNQMIQQFGAKDLSMAEEKLEEIGKNLDEKEKEYNEGFDKLESILEKIAQMNFIEI